MLATQAGTIKGNNRDLMTWKIYLRYLGVNIESSEKKKKKTYLGKHDRTK